MVKSPAEQDLLRQAGALGTTAMRQGLATLAAGVAETDVAAAVAQSVTAGGGVPYNIVIETYGEEGADDDRLPPPHYAAGHLLADGDLFTIDMSGIRAGYLFDFSRSRVIGAEPTSEQRDLLELSRAIVDAVVAELRPGRTAGDAATVGATMLTGHGFPLAEQEFAALGHGIGMGFEPPFLVPGDPTPIVPGMCFAVERHLVRDGTGATFERNVLVTDEGPELLSHPPD
jgi:Xaa-Pro aminopeptidase